MFPSSSSFKHQTPWPLILDLTAHLLDPQTLALASCVSRSWRSALSSDDHWLAHCLSHYPALAPTASSPRRLFSLLRSSSSLRNRTPCKPRISLDSLIFSVDIFHRGTPILSLLKLGEEWNNSNNKHRWRLVFRFDLEVGQGKEGEVEEGGELRVVWNVVTKGCGGAFVMMDQVGKGKRAVSSGEEVEEMWFSEELPGPACCSRVSGGGRLMTEVVVGLRRKGGGGGRRVVERVGLGLMSGVEWRYLSVDDALIYLQHFLLS